MQKFKTIAVIISVLIAVVVPLLTAMQAKRNLATYPIVKFDIEPYDPRDLMYGHYMTFTTKWNWKGGKPNEKACGYGECCLCVGEGDSNPEVSMQKCISKYEKLPSCKHTLHGYYQGADAFDVGINRYYVDENIALPLEKLFREGKLKFSIGMGMNPKGKPVVEHLYLNDMVLKDFLGLHGGIVDDPDYKKPEEGEVPVSKNPTL